MRRTAFLPLVAALAGCQTARPPAPSASGSASPVETEQVVYVVRHAERQSAADDTPLSSAGEARALALRDSLRRWGAPTSAYATGYVRTQSTASLAAPGLAVQRYDASPDPVADARALAARLRAAPAPSTGTGAGPVLVVGHSNTVPPTLTAFDGRPRRDFASGDHDGVYVVRIRQAWTRTPAGFVAASEPSVRVERRAFGADDGVASPE